MTIKNGVDGIIGRRIKGVVIKKAKMGSGAPASQLFLLFDDGNYYEFYTYNCSISTTSGVAAGSLEGVLDYMSESLEPIYVKYQE